MTENTAGLRNAAEAALTAPKPGRHLGQSQALRHQLARLVEGAQDAILAMDLDGIVTFWNRGAARLYGYRVEEIVGRSASILAPPERRDEVLELIGRVARGDAVDRYETERFTKLGQQLYVSLALSPIRDAGGAIVGISTIAHDISERKCAEDTEILLRTVLDRLPQRVFFKDLSSNYLFVNENYARDLGVSREAFVGKDDYAFYPREVAAKYRADDRRILEAGKVEELEEAYVVGGEERAVQTIKAPVRDRSGRTTRLLGIFWDVTDRKRAEAELRGYREGLEQMVSIRAREAAEEAVRLSEIRYRRLFEAAQDAILILDAPSGEILDVNPSLVELLGYSCDEIRGKHLWEIGAFTDIAASKTAFAELLKKGYLRYDDLPLESKDGRRIDVEFVGNVYDAGGEAVIQCNIRDITARKRSEAALTESRKLLQATERLAHIGGWQWEIARDTVVWSDEVYRIFGRNPAEWTPTVEAYLAAVHPDDRQRIRDAIDASRAHGIPLAYEHRLIRPDGAERSVQVVAELRYDATGDAISMNGTCHDITERKQSEAELRQSHAMLIRTEQLGGIGGWHWDVGSSSMVWSDELCRLFGRDPEGFVPSLQTLFAGIHEDDRRRVEEAIDAVLQDLEEVNLEFRVVRPDRSERYAELRAAALRDGNGAVTRLTGTAQDITTRKRAEEKIREEEAKFRSLVEQNVAGIIMIRRDATIAYTNPYWARLNGYAAAETIGHSIFEYIPQSEHALVGEQLEKQFSEAGGLVQLATSMLAKDGRRVETLVNASPGIYEGQPVSIAVLVDLTEHKRAEAALHESQQLVAGLLNAITVRVFWKDKHLVYLGCNAPFARDAGFASAEDVVGKDDYQMGWREHAAKYRNDDQQVIESGCSKLLIEEPLTTADGKALTILTNKIPLRNASGQITGVLGTYMDITERIEAQRTLERVNRTLRTLSRANEVMVRAANEDELLREMCRTIVEAGGYRMAWFGRVEHDAARSVIPVAWAGEVGDYLEKVRFTWGDKPSGQGLPGRAIRSGEPQIAQDFVGDPRTISREEAAKCGFASAVALPLRNGAVFGALHIYAGEPDAFDEAALRLLQELADDLTYAIRSLREHAAHEALDRRWRASLEETVGALVSTVEMRDPYTAGHQRRVAALAAAIGRERKFSKQRVRGIHFAASIHDLGKISVPAEILSKPGRLSPLEYQLIQAHPQVGHDILAGVDFPWPIAETVLQHHERLDGSGYPRGLKGDAIIPEAKILAVADVVEAMMARRPYREALGLDAALAELEKGKGRLYDPAAVDACIALFREKGFDFAS